MARSNNGYTGNTPGSSLKEVQYTVVNPSANLGVNRAMMKVGSLSKAVGVDGRATGCLKKFPGYRLLTTLETAQENAYGDIYFFKAFSISYGNTVVHGFMVHGSQNHATHLRPVNIHYYKDSSWSVVQIAANVSATTAMGLAVIGTKLFIGIENHVETIETAQTSFPKVFYFDSSTLGYTLRSLGPGTLSAPPEMVAGTSITEVSGVKYVLPYVDNTPRVMQEACDHDTLGLTEGEYRYAYRYVNHALGLISGMTTTGLEVTVPEGGRVQVRLDCTCVELTPVPAQTFSDGGVVLADYPDIRRFTHVEIFRTISTSIGSSAFQGGILYRTGTATITVDTGGVYVWSYVDYLRDNTLVSRAVYQPFLDETGTPDSSGVITAYQGIILLGGGDEDNISRAKLSWTSPLSSDTENFPIELETYLPAVDDEIISFIENADLLYGMSKNGIWKIQKYGAQLMFGKIQVARGPVNANATAVSDATVIIIGQGQVLMLHNNSSQLVGVAALDKLVTDTDVYWGDTLDNISVCVDGALGAVTILNPDKEEAVLIWRATNNITQLENMNFKLCASGIHPEDGGIQRGFFITEAGRIYYADMERENAKHTMHGVTGTVNGTVASTNLSTLTVDLEGAGTFDSANVVGCFIHIHELGETRKIASASTTRLVVDSVFTENPAGYTFSLDYIPFEVRYWPLGWPQDKGYPRYLFRRWIAQGMAFAVSNLSENAVGTAAYNKIKGGFYQNLGDTMGESGTIALDSVIRDSELSVNATGNILEPGITQLGSDIDFELTALNVRVKNTLSENPLSGTQ